MVYSLTTIPGETIMRFPKWRKATWALIIWCALILAWAIGGAASNSCDSQVDEASKAGCAVGTGLGVAFILAIGFFGFVFLSLIWLMSRPKVRTCPTCGHDVKKGFTACQSCGHSFAPAAQ